MALTTRHSLTSAKDDVHARVAAGIAALADWAAALRFEDIPEASRKRMVMILGDDLAAIVAAQDEPEVRRAQEKLQSRTQASEATIFRARRPRADRWNAAVANGLAADWVELDEGYRKAVGHPGIYTLPALLAEGEASGATAREILVAGVASYEITARVARAWKFPQPPVLHPHAMLNALGAAAAVGVVRRLSAVDLRSAITGATTLVSVGPYNHAVEGALVRNVWPAVGAQAGMHMVDWVECGIGGLPGSPYDVYTRALGGEALPEYLTSDLGREWAVANGYHKIYACCQYAHSSVEATLSISSEERAALNPRAISRILIEVHPLGLTLNNYHPATSLGAKFSLPHAIAATLVFGEAGHKSFSAASLNHPDVVRLRERVLLKPYPEQRPWPLDRPARVTVEIEDGRSLSGQCLSARGGPDRPFEDADLLRKVSSLSAESMPGLAAEIEALAAGELQALDRPWRSSVERFYSASR